MKYKLLKKYFGYASFRGEQEKVIDTLLSDRDVLCVMPTGAGKSICYQIPALIKEGVTLVISPLISLMNDQVMALKNAGIRGAYINSTLNAQQYGKVIKNIGMNTYKIIYVAPERLKSPAFIDICQQIDISMIAVDEAHCVSQWGQDFRPGYLGIAEFIDNLPVRPTVSAFTATATDRVKSDIIRLLGLQSPEIITTGFDRPNLYFGVIKPKSKKTELIKILTGRKGKSGIIYCATRKNVEEICEFINSEGFSATRYHAGLSPEERQKNQDDFTYDRKEIMVATNAFGMGIDKSNISFVVHYNMPKDLESYYQEAGRAGRDGQKADCILLYGGKDVKLNEFLIENSEPNPELTPSEVQTLKNIELERLKYMTYYATSKDCLRHYILKYFGENTKNYCGNCSCCLNEYETVDATDEARKIVFAVNETGQRFGKGIITDLLRGSDSEKIIRWRLTETASFGILSSLKEREIRDIIDYLTDENYLITDGDKYPVLKIGPEGRSLLRSERQISVKTLKKSRTEIKTSPVGAADAELFTALKNLRKELAANQGVPPYVVFPDTTLIEMCAVKPLTISDMLEIKGVGLKKAERYGKKFIELIKTYL